VANLSATVIGANIGHPLNRGRVAWWMPVPGRLGGAALIDLIGRYPAVLMGSPVWQSGWPYPAINLNGSTQYARADAADLPNLGNVTVGIRFTPAAGFITAGGELIVRAASGGDVARGCRIHWNTAEGLHTDAYGGYAYRSPGYAMTAGVEYTIALALDAATGDYAQYYSQGQAITTTMLSSVSGNYTAGLPFAIGSQFGSAESSAIRLAEAWVYDRILTAREVADIHRQSRLGYPDLLIRGRTPITAMVAPAIGPTPYYHRMLGGAA